MARVRWGVIGAGGIARRRTIPEGILAAADAELTVVYSPNSGAEVARQFGVRVAATEAEVYESDVDAVYIASPVDCHRRQVERAASAGLHILCEKPLATNLADAKQMVAACESAGVTFGVNFMMRQHAHHRRVAELVRTYAIGKPVYARAQLSCWYPPAIGAWRQDPQRGGGGALPDLASHCIDLLEFMLGQKVSSVFCMKANIVHTYPVEDAAIVLLEFCGGAVATVDCLFNAPDEAVRNRLELYGSKGSLLAEGTIGQAQSGTLQWLRGPAAGGYEAGQKRVEAGAAIDFPLPEGNLYRAQIEDFCEAIGQQRQPLASGVQGMEIQRVLAACDRSAAYGAKMQISSLD